MEGSASVGGLTSSSRPSEVVGTLALPPCSSTIDGELLKTLRKAADVGMYIKWE